MKLLADFAARSFSSLKGLLGAMALVGVLSLTLAAAPLPAMAEEGGSASDENATQTVTVYHFEMVYYDDPTFEDWGVPELTGLRLIGTSTVEGLKPGDVVRAWDQVGTHPGFSFFDGWPRELTVSEDPSENAIQMNYIRQSSEVTVNYYEASLLDNMAAMPLYGNTIVENVGDHMVEFTKMGSEVLDRGLYAEVLTGDELAEETDMVDGLAYAGSYPDDVFVSMDTSKNEINLVYTRPTVRPDDVEVGRRSRRGGAAGARRCPRRAGDGRRGRRCCSGRLCGRQGARRHAGGRRGIRERGEFRHPSCRGFV